MTDKTETLLPYVKLKFSLQHPDLEACYADGYECAMREDEESNNPFNSGSSEFDYWKDGWWSGFYQEAPLYQWEAPIDVLQQGEVSVVSPGEAVNDNNFGYDTKRFVGRVVKVAGAIAATAIVGYQLLDLVG